MVISTTLVFILLALFLIGVGVWLFAPIGPRSKAWIVFGLFVIGALVLLHYAGWLRVS